MSSFCPCCDNPYPYANPLRNDDMNQDQTDTDLWKTCKTMNNEHIYCNFNQPHERNLAILSILFTCTKLLVVGDNSHAEHVEDPLLLLLLHLLLPRYLPPAPTSIQPTQVVEISPLQLGPTVLRHQAPASSLPPPSHSPCCWSWSLGRQPFTGWWRVFTTVYSSNSNVAFYTSSIHIAHLIYSLFTYEFASVHILDGCSLCTGQLHLCIPSLLGVVIGYFSALPCQLPGEGTN